MRQNRLQNVIIPRVRLRHIEQQIVGNFRQAHPVGRSSQRPVDEHRRVRPRQNVHLPHALRQRRSLQPKRPRERPLQFIRQRRVLRPEIRGRLRLVLRRVRLFRLKILCRRANDAIAPVCGRNVQIAAALRCLRLDFHNIAQKLRGLCPAKRLLRLKKAPVRAHIRRVARIVNRRLHALWRFGGCHGGLFHRRLLLRRGCRARAEQQTKRQCPAPDSQSLLPCFHSVRFLPNSGFFP